MVSLLTPPSLLPEYLTPLALSHTYALFSRLYLQGPTPDLIPFIEVIPELASSLPLSVPPSPRSTPPPSLPSFLAADHYHLFGFNVFPYQSMFLGEENNLGGPVTENVLAFYHNVGFETANSTDQAFSNESPDHIGLELKLMAFLCMGEADAREDGLDQLALRMQTLQTHFLDEHLLRWLVSFVQAVRGQNFPFYSALADLTLEIVLNHRIEMGEHLLSVEFALPFVPALLENEKTDLKAIATFLLTPVYSGLYLSRDDIGRLARKLNLPRGFGDRQQMLTNLLRVAADYDLLAALLADIQSTLDGWRMAYQIYLEEDTPIGKIADVWLQRLGVTAQLLLKMKEVI